MSQLHNKIIIVTGGSSGIGKASVEHIHHLGGIVHSIDKTVLKTDLSIQSHLVDVIDFEKIKFIINEISNKYGRIDGLFCAAGIYCMGSVEDVSLNLFKEVIDVNLMGTINLLKATLPIMKKQNMSSIVLMGSDQTLIAKPNAAAYGITKAAIGQLTKSLAIDYSKFGIRTNCISPGTIDTPLTRKAITQRSKERQMNEDDIYKSICEKLPLGRIGKSEEIAKLVAFLLSEHSSYMTGSLVAIDGGYTAQ